MQILTSKNKNKNRIKDISTKIDSLENLQSINLSNNLIIVPTVLFSLININYMDLSYNQITVLDKAIINCTKLDYIDLSSNIINNLPLELRLLNCSIKINLKNNLFSSPLSDIIESNIYKPEEYKLWVPLQKIINDGIVVNRNKLELLLPKEACSRYTLPLIQLFFNLVDQDIPTNTVENRTTTAQNESISIHQLIRSLSYINITLTKKHQEVIMLLFGVDDTSNK